jgi:Cu/Ag efflux protein CusF
MKRVLLLVGCVATLIGCAATEKSTSKPTPPPPAAAQPMGGTIGQDVSTVTAEVEKIDLKKRLVTLRGPDGKKVTVHVGEEARNLAQVKKGDRVKVAYYESVAYQVRKPGEATPGVSVAASAARAQPGAQPGGIAGSVTTVTSTIQAIDPRKPSVTLQGPDGDLVTIKVRDPKKLENVKVGDLVEISYSEAVAISVDKPD